MNVTFSMISYVLGQKHRIRESKDAYFDASLTSVKRYRGMVEKGQLYSIPIKRVGELSVHPQANLKQCAFVAWGDGSEETLGYWNKLKDGKRLPFDVIYLEDIEYEEDLLEELIEWMLKLHIWEENLRDTVSKNQGDLISILMEGKKIIGLPIAIFDKNFIVLGATEDYFNCFPDVRDRLINKQMAQSDIMFLLHDEDYLNADDKKDIFIFPSSPAEQNLLCYNILFSGEFSARILMALPKYEIHRGITQLYSIFVKYVEQIYLNNFKNFPAGNQDDALHHLFKKYLFHSRRKDYEVDFHALNMYNWYRNDEYQIIVLQIFGAREFERGASYLCQQLERMFEYSCTFRTDREIIWIINYTRENTIKDKENFFSNFPYLIRDFGCKAGISDFFSDFSMLSNYRRQADIALELGNQKNPTRWYYFFTDYTLDYMISQMTTLFTPDQLAHKGLQKLHAYDQEHDTEFVKTLQYYILNRFNASEAAQKLYIHRTTFIRRMERIEQLISLNLEDSDELVHLQLSFKMLEGKETKNEGV